MRKVRTRPWDAADYLKTDADMDAYLEAALEDGDPQLITAALGDIAKAKGMTKIATSPRPIPRKTTRDISREDSISHVFSQGVSRTQQGGFTGSCGLGTGSNGHQRALCGRNTRSRTPGPLSGAFGPVGCWSDLSCWKWVVGPQMTLPVRIPALVAPTGVH